MLTRDLNVITPQEKGRERVGEPRPHPQQTWESINKNEGKPDLEWLQQCDDFMLDVPKFNNLSIIPLYM
jgi:hypothetical protein